MRDPNRIDPILQKVSEIWHKYPDLRLSQLIMNSMHNVQCIQAYNYEDSSLDFSWAEGD